MKEGVLPLIPRRRGLQVIAYGLGASLVAACDTPASPSPIPTAIPIPTEAAKRTENTDELKSRIEQKFGVEIRTLEEAYREDGLMFPPANSNAYRNIRGWDYDRLALLETVLETVPNHFYEPDAEGKKTRIIAGIRGTRCPLGDKTGNFIGVGATFDPKSPVNSFREAAHEFIHLKTPNDSCDPVLSPDIVWFKKVDAILGAPFKDLRDVLEQRRKDDQDRFIRSIGGTITRKDGDTFMSYKASSQEEKDRVDAYSSLQYGIVRSETPEEFISTMGEMYVYGKKHFLDVYSGLLSPQQAGELYAFMREDVFRGKEYEMFPPKLR